MATTIALNVGAAAVPPGSVGYGNVVLTEGNAANVKILSVVVYIVARAGRFVPITVTLPQGTSGVGPAGGGAGTDGGGYPLAQNTAASFGFSFPPVAGTLVAHAIVDDGSDVTATKAVTVG